MAHNKRKIPFNIIPAGTTSKEQYCPDEQFVGKSDQCNNGEIEGNLNLSFVQKICVGLLLARWMDDGWMRNLFLAEHFQLKDASSLHGIEYQDEDRELRH